MSAANADDVPVAWFSAESAARDLVAGANLTWPGRAELDATEEVLALTMFLSGLAPGAALSTEQLVEVSGRLTGGDEWWLKWCADRFETLTRELGAADIGLAAGVWKRLVKSRTADAAPGGGAARDYPAGLDGARFVVRLHLRDGR